MVTGDLFQQHKAMMREAITRKDTLRVKMLLKTPYVDPNDYFLDDPGPVTTQYSHARYIHMACYFNPDNPDLIRALMDAGADPTLLANDGFWGTAIFVLFKNTPVEPMIELAESLKITGCTDGLLALLAFKRSGSPFADPIDSINRVLKLGADINYVNEPIAHGFLKCSPLAWLYENPQSFVSPAQQKSVADFLISLGAKYIKMSS